MPLPPSTHLLPHAPAGRGARPWQERGEGASPCGTILSPLQVGLSIFYLCNCHLSTIYRANRIKRDNIKIVAQQLSGWGGGGGTRDSWNFLSLLFKGEKARIVYLFQSTPQEFRDHPPGSSPGTGTTSQRPSAPRTGLVTSPPKSVGSVQ